MKDRFRLLFGFSLAAPIALITMLVSLLRGRSKAIKIIGPKVTVLAKSLQQFFPPAIDAAGDFDTFKRKLSEKRKIWRLLYDYPIEFPDEDTASLIIRNCPFAEALIKLKIPEFGSYMCQGDWEVAKDNHDKWRFERSCTIGTGSRFCDFTYKRISSER